MRERREGRHHFTKINGECVHEHMHYMCSTLQITQRHVTKKKTDYTL